MIKVSKKVIPNVGINEEDSKKLEEMFGQNSKDGWD